MGIRDYIGEHFITICVYATIAALTLGAAYLIFIIQDGSASSMPCIGGKC